MSRRPPTGAALVALSLLAAACGPSTPTTSPTAPPEAQTTLAAVPAAAIASPPAAASSAASVTPAVSASPAASPSAAVGSVASTPASVTRLTLDPSASSASYRAREQLAGNTLPSDAVGTSKGVSGAIALTSEGGVVADQSQISVDLSQLQSNESRRDNYIKSNTLQTGQFPQAVFVPRQAQGLPSPLPTSGEAQFELTGDLTVHGVSKPATWQVTAQFDPGSVTGKATTNVKITDFGMTPPKVGPVLGIEDGLVLEIAFTASRGS